MDMDTLLVEPAGLERVESALGRFFEESKLRAARISPGYHGLWETLEQCTAGGKRFRPRLVMSAYQMLGGSDVGNAAEVGAAFELLHTALIVHDDVIDRDFVRRGIPNVSGRYRMIAEKAGMTPEGARHVGFSAGVIAGDLALSNAHRLLERVETTAGVRRRLGEILDEAVFASAAGEFLDIETSFDTTIPPLEDIVHMARLKTSVYSFEGPLQAGAVLAGAEEDVITRLGDFGRDAGIAYQVADDILGVFGNETRTGKTNWGDLREGKRTALMSFVSTRPEWESISSLVGNPAMSAADADYVRRILVDSGARDYSADLAADYAARARTHLDSDTVPPALRAVLDPVVSAVVDRVH
ncbi:polyprenyl synthetase family protein [Arthrobacter echini]|uniref:Polyprenyl synthetase family protein n=1 Tax=Arthrobacter echini TaxID=1529066 RepID=A0A5D0XTN7_9MICC|nr:polyprenyl synthetase family protein [Arthrobacter echini]TYD00028.1 polyprenyl synthetase family protein [Arthrobacter echini]